ncbi:hypothetical protein OSB04_023988 [Centaurea solstitialis]|uniref:Uncharacterized protein n=1 Tax=Centaurea solstitialis TaxID=347529 RepID=A0AA38WDG0_9ASTR|nr:hypothetical protein OSB04_023988 [Centaurea solstitialis]
MARCASKGGKGVQRGRQGTNVSNSFQILPRVSQRKTQPDQNLTKAKQKPLREREVLTFATRSGRQDFAIVKEQNSENSAPIPTLRRETLYFAMRSSEQERASSSCNVRDHPCLSFDSDNILRSEKMSLMIELDRLKKRDIEIRSIVDLHFVDEIGFGDRLSDLLRREYRDRFGIVRLVHDKAATGLCGGHFITLIAEKLGTLTPKVCETLTKLSPLGFLDKVLFRSMKLLAPGPQRGTFVWIGDAASHEGPIGMATSPPQPTFPGQSSNPPPANQQSQQSGS